MPMAVGVLLIAVAVNFLSGLVSNPPDAGPGDIWSLDPRASAVCGGGVIVVGAILILSTFGRWRKAQSARRGR